MMRLMRTVSVKTRIVGLVVVLLVGGIWGLAVRVSIAVQRDLEQLLSQQLSTTVRLAADALDQDEAGPVVRAYSASERLMKAGRN